MSVINNTKRWYDQNPTVSLAISILRNANTENQKQVAKFILKNYPNIESLKAQAKKSSIFERRWYDHDEQVFLAVELFRLATPDIQNNLAIEVINYLCSLEEPIST